MKQALIVTPIATSIPKMDIDYIGLDTGAYKIKEKGYPLSFIVGDFDSGSFKESDFLGIPIYRYPIEKDQTDSELAIDLCLEKGYDQIILWEGISNRLDHTLINLKLLEKTKGKLILLDEKHRCSFYGKGKHHFTNEYKHISFFPLEPSIISLQGFQYELEQQSVDRDSLYLVSNHVKDNGTLTIHSGSILCIQSKQK